MKFYLRETFYFHGDIFYYQADNFYYLLKKVYYKLCNGRYKVSNTCYKLCNACYKVCNKKISYRIGKTFRHLGKNISKQGKNFKEEMPALLLRHYSKSYGVVLRHRTGPLSRPIIPTFRDTAPSAGAENHKKKVFQACRLSCNFALEKLCIAQ